MTIFDKIFWAVLAAWFGMCIYLLWPLHPAAVVGIFGFMIYYTGIEIHTFLRDKEECDC